MKNLMVKYTIIEGCHEYSGLGFIKTDKTGDAFEKEFIDTECFEVEDAGGIWLSTCHERGARIDQVKEVTEDHIKQYEGLTNFYQKISPADINKEVALVCCVIQKEELIPNGLLWSFDKSYDLARQYVDKFPPNSIDFENEGVDFEEHVIQFVNSVIS